MKYIKLFENFDSYDPYELMITPPNKKAEMIIEELEKSEPNLDFIKDLIELGANLDWRGEDNKPILYYAIYKNQVEVVKMLIDNDVDVRVKIGSFNSTPLLESIHKDPEIVRMLIDAGADVNATSSFNSETPIYLAASYNRPIVMQMLLDAGADINIQDEEGNTPLHIAATHGEERGIDNLLKFGADGDIKNNRGYTWRAIWDMGGDFEWEDEE